MNRYLDSSRERAASAIELVLVVVILGLLAALAIPRLSRAGQGGVEAELRGRLMVLRTALELYHRDHGAYPCEAANSLAAGEPRDDNVLDGGAASGDVLDAQFTPCFVEQLTKFTSKAGSISEKKEGLFAFGPYLRDGVPVSPLTKANDGQARMLVVGGATVPGFQRAFPHFDWVYNRDTGEIAVNSDELDAEGKRFDEY